jgi:hypothetical protein
MRVLTSALVAMVAVSAGVHIRAQAPPAAEAQKLSFEVASIKPNKSGLRLESTRGPVDVVVVDRVEPPTPD